MEDSWIFFSGTSEHCILLYSSSSVELLSSPNIMKGSFYLHELSCINTSTRWHGSARFNATETRSTRRTRHNLFTVYFIRFWTYFVYQLGYIHDKNGSYWYFLYQPVTDSLYLQFISSVCLWNKGGKQRMKNSIQCVPRQIISNFNFKYFSYGKFLLVKWLHLVIFCSYKQLQNFLFF